MSDEMIQLQQKIIHYQSELKRYRQKIIDYQNSSRTVLIDQLKMEINQLQLQLTEIEEKKYNEYDSISQKVASKEKQLETYRQEIEKCNQELLSSKEELTKVNNKLKSLSEERDSLGVELKKLLEKNELLERTSQNSQKSIETKEKEMSKLKKYLQEVEEKLNEAIRKAEKLQDLNQVLTEEKLRIHVQAEEQSASFQGVLDQMTKMEEQYESLQIKLEDNTARYQAVEEEKAKWVSFHQEAIREKEKLQKENDQLRAELTRKKNVVEEKEQEYKELVQKRQDEYKRLNTIEVQFKELSEDYESLKEYVEQLEPEETRDGENGFQQPKQNLYQLVIEEKANEPQSEPEPMGVSEQQNVDLQMVEWLMSAFAGGTETGKPGDMAKLIENQIEQLTEEIRKLEGKEERE